MLDEGLRAAILALHDKGVGVRTIARMSATCRRVSPSGSSARRT
jgi:hypothetical protein